MIIWSVLALIVVLVFVYPWMQDRREEQLAEKLKRLHDAGEANALIDGAIAESKREGEFLHKLPRHRRRLY